MLDDILLLYVRLRVIGDVVFVYCVCVRCLSTYWVALHGLDCLVLFECVCGCCLICVMCGLLCDVVVVSGCAVVFCLDVVVRACGC